ncbi:MAG: biopolymer transporter ExbD [Gammaproteobacteria bacterium]|nr:biopolymer transporter ExbD [Gammaproteobacteria bacterium]
MAFGNSGQLRSNAPVGEINMVPLIDVMLVLVVIFLVTAPLLSHAVKIELPQAASTPDTQAPSEAVDLALDAGGQVFWNDKAVDDGALKALMTEAAERQPQPELHIRADKNTRYERIAQLMSQASLAGLNKLGFVSDPGNAR